MTEEYVPQEGDRVKVTFEAKVSSILDGHSVQLMDSNFDFYEFSASSPVDGFELEKIETPLERGWYLFSSPGMNDRVFWYNGATFIGVSWSTEDTITRLEPVK